MSALALSSHDHDSPVTLPAAPSRTAEYAEPTGTIFLDRRLNGPRRSANGGFAAGSLAQHIDAETVTVVLHRPIPLGLELPVVGDGRGGGVVHHRGRLIALARPGQLSDSPAPPRPTYDEALLARSRYPLAGVRHPLADCVVCGVDRTDGMHVTLGPLEGTAGRLAAPWSVDTRIAHAGTADYPAVWGALDCPSYPAHALENRILCLLGTITARVERRPHVGEHLVIHSWTREQHGRRYETSAAMVDSRGALVARADATWIAVKHTRVAALAAWRW